MASNLSSLGFTPSTPASGGPAPAAPGAQAGTSPSNLSSLGFKPTTPSNPAASSGNASQPGFLQSAAQSIAQPFLQLTRLPAGLIAEGLGAVTGNKTLQDNGAAAASNQPYDFGYLGKVNAAGYDANGKPLGLGGSTAQAVGAGLQIAPWFVGAGEAEPALAAGETAAKAGIATTIAKGAAGAAGIGASQGLGQELQNEGETGQYSIGNLTKATVGGGLTGAATGGILSGAGALGSAFLDNLAENTPGSRLSEQANRLKTLANAVADSKTNPIDTITTMMKNSTEPLLTVLDGRVNTEALETALDQGQSAVNSQAREIVAGMTGRVPLADFQDAVEQAVKDNPTIRGAGGVQKALSKVQSMFEDYAKTYGDADGSISYQALNEIRTSMNKYFDADTVDLERAMGNTAREFLYDSDSGSPELKALMQQWGKLEDAQNFAQKLRNSVVKGGRLGKYLADMVGSGVGASVGSAFGPFGTAAGAAAGGIVTDKVATALQGNYFNPILSQPASTLSRFIGNVGSSVPADIARQATIRSFVPKNNQ